MCVRSLKDIRDGRLLPKAPGLAKAQRDFMTNPPKEPSSGVGRPSNVADDDLSVASGEVSSDLTSEEFLKEQRILIERSLERVWFQPSEQYKSWVNDPDLQLTFSFPTVCDV